MSDKAAQHSSKVTVLDSAFLDPNLSSEDADVAAASSSYLDLTDLDLVLIILNHNLPRLTAALWQRARLVVVADGGADRLLEAARRWEEEEEGGASGRRGRRQRRRNENGGDGGGEGEEHRETLLLPRFVPDAIVGDLDSISERARKHYESLGVRVVDLSPDQDSTDLQKCLSFAAAEVGKSPSTSPSSSLPPPPPPVFVAGALGGRLDHSLSAISTLYAIDAARRGKSEERNSGEDEGGRGFAAAAARFLGHVVLAGDGSLARLVPGPSFPSPPSSPSSPSPEVAVVKILPCAAVEGPGCGLVALGPPAPGVETSGLTWNLSKPKSKGEGEGEGEGGGGGTSPPLEMGGMQSTSNSIEGREVTVRTPVPLLWTTTLKEAWS